MKTRIQPQPTISSGWPATGVLFFFFLLAAAQPSLLSFGLKHISRAGSRETEDIRSRQTVEEKQVMPRACAAPIATRPAGADRPGKPEPTNTFLDACKVASYPFPQVKTNCYLSCRVYFSVTICLLSPLAK